MKNPFLKIPAAELSGIAHLSSGEDQFRHLLGEVVASLPPVKGPLSKRREWKMFGRERCRRAIRALRAWLGMNQRQFAPNSPWSQSYEESQQPTASAVQYYQQMLVDYEDRLIKAKALVSALQTEMQALSPAHLNLRVELVVESARPAIHPMKGFTKY